MNSRAIVRFAPSIARWRPPYSIAWRGPVSGADVAAAAGTATSARESCIMLERAAAA